MNRYTLILLFCLMLSACSESKQQSELKNSKELFLYSKKVDGGIYEDYKLYGYVNSEKKIIIEAKYDFAEPFEGDLAKVAMVKNTSDQLRRGKSEKLMWGLINESDSLLISMDYYELKDYQNDKFVALGPSQSFIFDAHGDTLKKLFHNEESNRYIGDSIKVVALNRELGLIDNDYNYIVKPRFNWIGDISENRILVTWRNKDNEEMIGYLNTDGKEVIPATYRQAGPFKNGSALARTFDTPPLIIDKSGIVIDTLDQNYIEKKVILPYTNPNFNLFENCIENLKQPNFFYAVYDCSDSLFKEKLLDNHYDSCLSGGECSHRTTHKLYKDGHLRISSGYESSPRITYSLNDNDFESAKTWAQSFIKATGFNIENASYSANDIYTITFNSDNGFDKGSISLNCLESKCEISPYIYSNY